MKEVKSIPIEKRKSENQFFNEKDFDFSDQQQNQNNTNKLFNFKNTNEKRGSSKLMESPTTTFPQQTKPLINVDEIFAGDNHISSNNNVNNSNILNQIDFNNIGSTSPYEVSNQSNFHQNNSIPLNTNDAFTNNNMNFNNNFGGNDNVYLYLC